MPEDPPQYTPGSIVNCVAYQDGRSLGQVALDDIRSVIESPEQFIWIGLRDPDTAMLARIQKEFGLHDLAIEDATRAHQRPKLEDYEDSLFIVLRTVELIDEEVVFGETHVFLGARFIVSIRHGVSTSYTPVRARCEATPLLLRKGPAFVVYALMDFIVDQYFPVSDDLETRLEELEEEIFSNRFDSGTTERIYTLKRNLVALKRAVSPLVEVCNRLMRFDSRIIPEDVRVYFRDVYDHVYRINETVDNLRELLTTALEANLSLIAVRQNEVMRQLAAWAAILAVPTAIAGIYGMNFRHMPELHWRAGYPLVLGLIGGTCVFLYRRFKRIGWL